MAALHVLTNNGHAPDAKTLAAHLREQADWIESGVIEDVVSIMVIFERTDGTLHRNTCGRSVSLAEAIGLLEIAKRNILNSMV